jgi:hypothetical protein
MSIAIALLCVAALHAQDTDIARIEYTYVPQTNSDNTINRFRGFVNFPIRMGWEGSYLIPGVEYRNVDLDIEDPVPFDISKLDRFQLFRISLGYTFKVGKEWRIGVKGGAEIASNFESRSVVNSDVRFTGEGYLILDRSADSISKPSRLIVGLQYSTNAGRPFPLPIINYYRKFHPDWSYSVGSPKTNLKYSMSKKQAIQGFITVDGLFSNLQNDLIIPGANNTQTVADNISMTVVLGGLGYEYFFSDHILFYFYGGYTGFNEIRLRDTNRNNVYTLNRDNTFYLRSGFKLKI